MNPTPLSTRSAAPITPARLGRIPRWSPIANEIMSKPQITKFTFWTQPPGHAASALIGSFT
jgi:hypothetical protein